MTKEANLPTSGYALDRVYAPRQKYEILPPSDTHNASEDNVTLGWDWRITGEEGFDVILTVQCDPSQQRSESIDVAIVGEFRIAGDTQTVDLMSFVRVHAPSILMAYAREIVASLTGRGATGAVHLPPLNVKTIMDRMDLSITTGARQLRENPTMLRLTGGAAVTAE